MAAVGGLWDLPPPKLALEARLSRFVAEVAVAEAGAAPVSAPGDEEVLLSPPDHDHLIHELPQAPEQPPLLSADEAARIAASQARLVAEMVREHSQRCRQEMACKKSAQRLDQHRKDLKREASTVDRQRTRAQDIDRLLARLEGASQKRATARWSLRSDTQPRSSVQKDTRGLAQSAHSSQPAIAMTMFSRRGRQAEELDKLRLACCFAQWCEHWARSQLRLVKARASNLAATSGKLSEEARKAVEREQLRQAQLQASMEAAQRTQEHAIQERDRLQSMSQRMESELSDERDRRRRAEDAIDRKMRQSMEERRGLCKVSSTLLGLRQQPAERTLTALCFATWQEAHKSSLLQAARKHTKSLASAAASFKAQALQTLDEERKHRALLEKRLASEQARVRAMEDKWQKSDADVNNMLAAVQQDWKKSDQEMQRIASLAQSAERGRLHAEDKLLQERMEWRRAHEHTLETLRLVTEECEHLESERQMQEERSATAVLNDEGERSSEADQRRRLAELGHRMWQKMTTKTDLPPIFAAWKKVVMSRADAALGHRTPQQAKAAPPASRGDPSAVRRDPDLTPVPQSLQTFSALDRARRRNSTLNQFAIKVVFARWAKLAKREAHARKPARKCDLAPLIAEEAQHLPAHIYTHGVHAIDSTCQKKRPKQHSPREGFVCSQPNRARLKDSADWAAEASAALVADIHRLVERVEAESPRQLALPPALASEQHTIPLITGEPEACYGSDSLLSVPVSSLPSVGAFKPSLDSRASDWLAGLGKQGGAAILDVRSDGVTATFTKSSEEPPPFGTCIEATPSISPFHRAGEPPLPPWMRPQHCRSAREIERRLDEVDTRLHDVFKIPY